MDDTADAEMVASVLKGGGAENELAQMTALQWLFNQAADYYKNGSMQTLFGVR